ncbi:MAG: hypothetical protein SF162_08480 [bacterium]|nr:hypothetical protein [bacterium]
MNDQPMSERGSDERDPEPVLNDPGTLPPASLSEDAAAETGDQDANAPDVSAQPDEPELAEVRTVPETDDEPVRMSIWAEYVPSTAPEADIDAALAAVASLGALTTTDDSDTAAESHPDSYADDDAATAPADELEADTLLFPPGRTANTAAAPLVDAAHMDAFDAVDDARSRRTARPAPSRSAAASMAVPPLTGLRRGSPGSLIPGLALIGVGAWLTFATTTGAAVDPLVLIGFAVGVVILSLFGYWAASGRWSRGALFTAAFVLLAAGLWIVTAPPPALNLNIGVPLTQAYPLFAAAVGIAMLVGGLLARPRTRATFAPGLVLLTAGVVGFLVTLGIIPTAVLETAAPLWFVPFVLLVILWLLPVIFRLRDRG